MFLTRPCLQENKTPYELAVEKGHTDVASMIADFCENGPNTLTKYEKSRESRRRKERERANTQVSNHFSRYSICDYLKLMYFLLWEP